MPFNVFQSLESTSSWRNVKRSCTSNLNLLISFLFVFFPNLACWKSASKRIPVSSIIFKLNFYFAVLLAKNNLVRGSVNFQGGKNEQQKEKRAIASLDFTLKMVHEWQSVGRSIKRDRNGAQINASSVKFALTCEIPWGLFLFLSHKILIFCCENRLVPSSLPPKFKFLGIENHQFVLFPMPGTETNKLSNRRISQ